MNSCKEFVLDDLMAITAVPVADMDVGMSSWQLRPTIEEEYFFPSYANAVTIGRQPAEPGGMLIPIVRFTGKAKDEESDAVAGRLHTVTVTCQADDRDAEVWDYLLLLERTPSHLVLTFRDGSRAFVSATEDTYLCTVERDGAKTSVEFRIQDLMGIQLLAAAVY